MTQSGQRLHVVSPKHIMGLSSMPVSVNKVIGNVVTSSGGISTRPVMRVSPLNIATSQTIGQVQVQPQLRATKNLKKNFEKNQTKIVPKSEFYLVSLF